MVHRGIRLGWPQKQLLWWPKLHLDFLSKRLTVASGEFDDERLRSTDLTLVIRIEMQIPLNLPIGN